MSWKLIVIGLIIAAIGYYLTGLVITPEMWSQSFVLGIPIHYFGYLMMGLGGIIVIAGITLIVAGGEDTRRATQQYAADTYGVCDECGQEIRGRYVPCNRCTSIFCSQKCARNHYYFAHEK